MPRIVIIVLLSMASMMPMAVGDVMAQDVDPKRAAQVKARYVELFVQYTQWPDSRFENERSEIIISTIGTCDFADILAERFRVADPINGRRLRLQRLKYPSANAGGSLDMDQVDAFNQALRRSHVVFFCEVENRNLRTLLSSLHERNTLTISDVDGFAVAGGMINLVLRGDKIRFQANADEIRKTELRVSSKVMQHAEVVETKRASDQ